MLYQQRTFTLPANTANNISEELWEYRMGIISAEEYFKRTGKKPDEEK